jgi:hypothetical protein
MGNQVNNNNNSSGGIGLGGAVFIVFLTLKLLAIDPIAGWSWWWVCSPLWIPLCIVLVLGLIFGLIAALSK